MSNLIVRDIEDSQISITLKSRDLCQSIVGDVEFFKASEGCEARYFWQAIRLYGEYLEVAEMRYILLFCKVGTPVSEQGDIP